MQLGYSVMLSVNTLPEASAIAWKSNSGMANFWLVKPSESLLDLQALSELPPKF